MFALINIWQIRHSITSVTCTIQYYSNQAKYLLAYKYIIRRDLRLKIKLFTRRDLRLNTNFIQGVVCVYTTNLNTNLYTRRGLRQYNKLYSLCKVWFASIDTDNNLVDTYTVFRRKKHKITGKSCQLLDTAKKCWETIVTS